MLRAAFKGQEIIVLSCTIVIVVLLSVFLNGFLTIENISNLLMRVAILGILGVGLAVVVIGRGLDLSIVANMVVSVGLVVQLLRDGHSPQVAIATGLCMALLTGFVNGWLVAFVEVPALFATLATGILVTGGSRLFLLSNDIQYLPESGRIINALGLTNFLGLPLAVWSFFLVLVLGAILLTTTRVGRILYAMGANPEAAKLAGLPVRPITLISYTLCGGTAFVAGIIMLGNVSSVNVNVAQGTMVFDVILVVILGGISLVGGRGSMLSVIIGTLLIGTILNGMTIMNINNDVQNIVKGFVLLAAILIDGFLHPFDEETARQGETM
ncbi:ABC transporter permease [Mesorhizobium sp. L2C067A000]|uniref:ABC transporter permease n=1 Tax=Mesorhizobium sp. L2C067A000 TaxID=1287106 RepID=UPI0003FF9FFD|nr:ABC transporter permease [Mesorhizobium sp. L2C067A000]